MIINDVITEVRRELGAVNSPLADFPDYGNLWAIVRALASVAVDQEQIVTNLRQSIFIQYATGVDLDLHAANYGLSRLLGQKAQGYALITGAFSQILSAGTVLTLQGRNYTVTRDTSIYALEVPVPIQAVDIGSEYNLAAGVVGSMPGRPEISITSGQYRLNGSPTGNITGGLDIESDASLRARIQSLFTRGIPSLTALILNQVQGITRVNIVEPTLGGGYFWVYVDNSSYDVLKAVEAVVAQYKPIGVAALVRALRVTNYDFTCSIRLNSTSNATLFRTQANSLLRSYLRGLAPGSQASLTDIALYIKANISPDMTVQVGSAIALAADEGADLGILNLTIVLI